MIGGVAIDFEEWLKPEYFICLSCPDAPTNAMG
jgi:hypothetical protein